MKSKLNTAIAALFVTTASMTTMATEVGETYITVGAINVSTDAFDELEGNSGLTIDSEDTAASFVVGYQINQNLSFEAGVIGEVEMSITLASNLNTTLNGKTLVVNSGSGVKAKADSYSLGLKYAIPVTNSLDVYGKAGVMFWDLKVNAVGSATYDGTTYSGSSEIYAHDGNDAYYGVGSSYAINSTTALNIDYITMEVDDEDFDGITASVSFDF